MTDDLRALDRRVAEVVMGWRVKPSCQKGYDFYFFVDGAGNQVEGTKGELSKDSLWRYQCPPFIADTDAGWGAMRLVVERMAELGFSWVIGRNEDRRRAKFYEPGGTRFGYHVCKSAPEAVARAALACFEEAKDA